MTTQNKHPLPTPPFYPIPNINNLRDAALHPLPTPHGKLRPGLLFRSADVSKLDLSGWQALHALGIAHVFDLRSKPEVERGQASSGTQPEWQAAMEKADVQRTWVPVFSEQDYSPEGLAGRYAKYMASSVQGFVAAYRDILRSGGDAYRTIFLYLANLPVSAAHGANDTPPRAALIHCTAGKDRTGVFFGVLFDFLGVERGAIAEEYNLTELGLQDVREDVVGRLLQSPGFRKYMLSLMTGEELSKEELAKLIEKGDAQVEEELAVSPEVREEGRQAALRMIGARKESMLATLDMVDREFGGSEKYMRTVCGLNDDDLEKLQRVLVIKK
ncbi:uncharacterized protein EKO05_0001241 [Ascochyta rabiei]|uniref:Protein tyrosine phosphatase n=1 Tax=Didymella rabiei TaxID=5454 RepID=A0A163D4L6_DIDRA|nr:uncharacterized protein EKO05_0001241 [Ascochyta rabiei]KZM22907.1 protein tyrosine phosphatase [Ascochyta rabiei]UPX10590.1 hypothetical protein EKO05_0001241 [Ascochyta rabiei]